MMELQIHDVIYIGVNAVLLFGFYLKIERRLTRLETIIEGLKKD